VLIAADHPELGAAAVEAIKGWRFTPALQNGVRVNVEAERRFRFGSSK